MDNLINPSSIPVVTDEGENYYEPSKPRVPNPRYPDGSYPVISLTKDPLEHRYFNFYEYNFSTSNAVLTGKIEGIVTEFQRATDQSIRIVKNKDGETIIFFNHDFIDWVTSSGSLRSFNSTSRQHFVARVIPSESNNTAESKRFIKLFDDEAKFDGTLPDKLKSMDANLFRKMGMDISSQVDSFLSEEVNRSKLRGRIRIHEFAHHEATETMFGSLKREVGELVSSLLDSVEVSGLEEFHSLHVDIQNNLRQLEFLQEILDGLEESFAMLQDLFAPGESADDQNLVKTLLNIHSSSIFANFRRTAQSKDIPIVDLSMLIRDQHSDIVIDPHFIGIAIILASGTFLSHEQQRILQHPDGGEFTNLTLLATLELYSKDPGNFLKRINASRLRLLIEIKIFDTLCLQLQTIKELILSSHKSKPRKSPSLIYRLRKFAYSLSRNPIIENLKSYSIDKIEVLSGRLNEYGDQIKKLRLLLQGNQNL